MEETPEQQYDRMLLELRESLDARTQAELRIVERRIEAEAEPELDRLPDHRTRD